MNCEEQKYAVDGLDPTSRGHELAVSCIDY